MQIINIIEIAIFFLKSDLDIYTSPLTSNISGALEIWWGISEIVFALCVTSSPILPSPRSAKPSGPVIFCKYLLNIILT